MDKLNIQVLKNTFSYDYLHLCPYKEESKNDSNCD